MAMTKTEQARMAALEEARDLARALRWPEREPPTPLTKDEIDAALQVSETKISRFGRAEYVRVVDFWSYNDYTGHARKLWYDGYFWTEGETTPNAHNGWSRRNGPFFHTKAEALRALRYYKTLEAARTLANLDKMITEEEG